MRRYLFPLVAIVISLFMNSCGDNPIVNLKEVAKSDLTSPLFLAFDNTLDEPVKKIWAFNDKEAVKGTITVVNDNLLRFKAEWFFDSWSYSGMKLNLTSNDNNKTYELHQVTVLGYNAISFGTAYVCIPSTNKGIDGICYQEDWYSRGLTASAFWEAMRKSSVDGATVDFTLNK